ncbi:MAG: acyl-CoA dehydratase activase [Pseudomonadota bacterium]
MKTQKNTHILGIDVGSVSIHVALLTLDGKVLYSDNTNHFGEVKKVLAKSLSLLNIQDIHYIACSESTPSFVCSNKVYDEQLTIIRAARHLYDSFDAILHIGGEKFSLSRFDHELNYMGARHNTSCAAGTGSFLDQQARRLNLLNGSEELSQRARANTKKIPDIATRCAVFAKTDLIHAQQEGYDIDQICDGLCLGLAKNIANTIFAQRKIKGKILFCGGVAQNRSVKKHLETITGLTFTIDSESSTYSAIGAALSLCDELHQQIHHEKLYLHSISDLFQFSEKQIIPQYPALELTLSQYPEFTTFLTYDDDGVEVDVYENPVTIDTSKGYLGIDVGSTSTKSILINDAGIPIVGLYTKTASQPVHAVQKIFKAFDHFFTTHGINIRILGCGTTGSGRRISGTIIGSDIEPDEITAHATAAVHLNKRVDTIIEIGGQDAKFTVLKDGMVTFSVMNTVCAAGTGSFIEEQALKLDCPLSDYSSRTQGIISPVTSDRCTVFMERDINYYLAQGYEKNEILGSVLHSVRDNYLTKVASISKIGDCVLFQGATARNKALVAAFEQKLNKPIHVSRYCHLTGALGVALLLKEKNAPQSTFRGFDLYKQTIPIRQETCQLCFNHCKLTIATIQGKALAYGFLCGRDYDTPQKISKQSDLSLLQTRKQARIKMHKPKVKHKFTLGIPKALHMFEDHDFWCDFFSSLGIQIISSQHLKSPVKLGKQTAGAEFCAPVVALHGHIQYLLEHADYVFLPFYHEDKVDTKDRRRQHCYYTQFTPSIISCRPDIDSKRLISPTIKYLYTTFHTKLELYKALKTMSSDFLFSFFDISAAYDRAMENKNKVGLNLKNLYSQHKHTPDGLQVALLGRPYTVLTDTMNNNIPLIFENLGVRPFFQDMLDFENYDFSSIEPLLKEIHWKYAAQILQAAYICSHTDNLYPVYISSFKCGPDSFAIDYFKMIMEKQNKPYLILELDEHDSSVGYQTRIEASVQAFTNHRQSIKSMIHTDYFDLHPRFLDKLDQQHIIFPNWDAFTGSLIVSVFKNEGYSAYLMEETPETLKQSMLTNTGQCIPLNAVAAGFIHTVKKQGLDPASCVLWLNPSEIACNVKMYPYHIQKIFDRHGQGFEKANIYKGELSLFDISFKASTQAYYAYMFGGLLRSVGCKIRPYEIIKGATDKALKTALTILCHTFENALSKENALKQCKQIFLSIETKIEQRPKVGIFGDLYVRDNHVMNQDLIKFIEDNGGEVITTPYYKYVKIIANSYFRKWFKEGKYLSLISNKALLAVMNTMEKRYYPYFEPFLTKEHHIVSNSYETILSDYGIQPEHTGESMDNILKIHHIINENPDMRFLIQTNPAFCCPGLITEAMALKIEANTGVPIVNITYDISGGNKNKAIIPYLRNPGKAVYSHSLKVSV